MEIEIVCPQKRGKEKEKEKGGKGKKKPRHSCRSQGIFTVI